MAIIIKTAEFGCAEESAPLAGEDSAINAIRCLDQARRHAAEMLARAQQEAIEIRQRAEEQGRRAGLAAIEKIAQEQVARHVQTLLPALQQAIDQIDESRSAWLSRWEQGALRLATAIAGRVIRREVCRTPEITLSLVQEALELAAGSADIQLRLHPDDFAALGNQVERLVADMSRLRQVRISADPQITQGGCRVETRFGTIDQQFEAQLNRIEQELHN